MHAPIMQCGGRRSRGRPQQRRATKTASAAHARVVYSILCALAVARIVQTLWTWSSGCNRKAALGGSRTAWLCLTAGFACFREEPGQWDGRQTSALGANRLRTRDGSGRPTTTDQTVHMGWDVGYTDGRMRPSRGMFDVLRRAPRGTRGTCRPIYPTPGQPVG